MSETRRWYSFFLTMVRSFRTVLQRGGALPFLLAFTVAFFAGATLTGCEPCEGDSCDAPLDETSDPLVSTFYKGPDWWETRTVYGRNFDPKGAPRVDISYKEWGKCKPTENRAMVPVPSGELSAQLCSSLGLTAQIINNKVAACIQSSTKIPANLWKYSWTNINAREVNYRVVDMGAGGKVLDTSGWIPTPGNGCPK